MIESDFLRKLIEWWFKEIQWAIIVTAMLGVGINNNSTPIIFMGLLSLIFFLLYYLTPVTNDLFKSFKNDVAETNKRNEKFNLPPYSNLSTTISFLFIIISINILNFLAMYYGIIIFSNYNP